MIEANNTVTPLQNSQFIEAIKSSNKDALLALIKVHGLNAHLKHSWVGDDDDGATHEFCGMPINIAAFLSQDEIATDLFEAGAEISPAYYEMDFGGCWNTTTVALIETALTRRLPGLTRALITKSGGIDWNYSNRIDRDDLAAGFNVKSLFCSIAESPGLISFLDQVGAFCGNVESSFVNVTRLTESTLKVVIDTVEVGHVSTMQEAFNIVVERVGFVPEIDPEDELDDLRSLSRTDVYVDAMIAKALQDAPKTAVLVQAIVESDRTAIDAFNVAHGMDDLLDYEYTESDAMDKYSCRFAGGGAALAALLKNEELAIYLIGLTADESLIAATISRDFSQGWDMRSVTLFEMALEFRFAELFAVLCKKYPDFNWNHRNAFDGDHKGSCTSGTELFDIFFESGQLREPDVNFLADVGFFAGQLNRRMFRIERNGDGFALKLSGVQVGRAASMGECLLMLKNKVDYYTEDDLRDQYHDRLAREEGVNFSLMDDDVPF